MRAQLSAEQLCRVLREAVAIGQKGLHEAFRTAYMAVNPQGRFRLLSFSPEATYTAYLPSEGGVAGVASTPIFPFYSLISKLPDDASVVLEAKDNALAVRWGRCRYKLPLLAAECPPIQFPDRKSCKIMGAAELREALRRVSFVPEEEAKAAYQSCVLVRPYKQGQVLVAATCGPLLCTALTPGIWEETTVFHMNTIKCLESILYGKQGGVEYYTARNEVTFFVDDRVLMLRSAAVGFPDIGKAFPKGRHGTLRLPRVELLGTLERASIYQNARIRLEVLKDKQVRVSATSDKGLHGGEEYLVPKGEPTWFEVSVLVPADSFLKLIQHQAEDFVEIVLHGSDLPLLIRGVNNSYLQLLAPMRF